MCVTSLFFEWAYLDLFSSMHYKHILQIFHGSFHPVVERSWPLGELQEQLINSFQQLLCPLWGLHIITYVSCPLKSQKTQSTSKRPQRSHHLNISHANPKTNILSPALMSNPRLHNTGMALLTTNTSSVFPDCNSPQQGMAGRWTENRPLCLSFRLNPWLFSQTLKYLQVWDGQHGSEEVTSGHSASPFTGRTLISISPFTLLFHHSIRVR